MTLEQKRIVLECHNRRQGASSRVQLEFGRTAIRQREENIPVVAKPSVTQVSSFLSYKRRRKDRGGVAVGKTSPQDIAAFGLANGSIRMLQYPAEMFSLQQHRLDPFGGACS